MSLDYYVIIFMLHTILLLLGSLMYNKTSHPGVYNIITCFVCKTFICRVVTKAVK